MNYFKRIETILIAFIILVLGVAYGLLSSNKANAPTTETNTQESAVTSRQVPAALVRYPGEDGKTALDLLKTNYRVETQKNDGMDESVKSIDGVEPDNSHSWAFYVNGSQSTAGAGMYVTKSTDSIEWKLEKIN